MEVAATNNDPGVIAVWYRGSAVAGPEAARSGLEILTLTLLSVTVLSH